MSQRNFATGEHIFVAEDVLTANGVVVALQGGEARIMVYDPAKGDTPYGIRGEGGHSTQTFVAESVLRKNPAKEHLTPGRSWEKR